MPALETVNNLPQRNFATVSTSKEVVVSKADVIEAEVIDTQAVSFRRRARISGYGEPPNLSSTQVDVQKIQNALRAAERGNTWMYFTIVRDMILGYSHLQAEWAKRKQVIIGQPYSLIPYDKSNKDDLIACDVIKQNIDHCENWFGGLDHLLDATLYPLSVAEKIFEPVTESDNASGKYKYPMRVVLKEISPVPYTLLCFQVPYAPSLVGSQKFNPDEWEGWLRFYETNSMGGIDWSLADIYRPDKERHIIHKGNTISPSIPPNYGGQIRAVLFWWLLATQDRDWWGLMMNKYGMPMIIGKADAAQKDTVDFLREAFALATQIGGLVVDKRAEVELAQMNATDGSNAHKIFSDFCNCEVSKLVVGQVLSSTPKSTGLGSGMAQQAEDVREGIKIYDQTRISDTLEKQLFSQILRVNGYAGRPPKIFFGGINVADSELFAKTQQMLSQAGYELTDEGITSATERLGYGIQRRKIPLPTSGGNLN